MNLKLILAQSGPDSPINQWLNQNPLILGGIFLTIGAVLIAIGIRQLRSGVAVGKWGQEHTGGMGTFISGVRILMGLIACGFGLFKMLFG